MFEWKPMQTFMYEKILCVFLFSFADLNEALNVVVERAL